MVQVLEENRQLATAVDNLHAQALDMQEQRLAKLSTLEESIKALSAAFEDAQVRGSGTSNPEPTTPPPHHATIPPSHHPTIPSL